MIKHTLRRMRPKLRKIYRKLSESPPPNLSGDRDVEHSWIAANIPEGPGKALDFGSGTTWLGFLAARKGFDVLAIDLQPVNWDYSLSNLKFQNVDLFDLTLTKDSLDLIINCSTIEHVGLKGRYSVKEEQPTGDLEAMNFLKHLLKPSKIMLLTLPIGKDIIYHPYHRVYGTKRLPNLLEGWEVLKKEFWLKNDKNRWIQVEKDIALAINTTPYYYGLGLYVLRKKQS